MSNQNEIIRELFNYLPNEKLSFERVDDRLILTMGEERKIVVIKHNDTWEQVKKKIDKRNDDIRECGICYEKNPDAMNCCVECNNRICIACFMILMIKNKGVNVCSFCRYSKGEELSDNEIPYMLKDILQKMPPKYVEDAMKKLQQHYQQTQTTVEG